MIKINRAIAAATIGGCPASASAMLDAIPADVVAALPSRLLAQLVDANWRLAEASKALANADAIADGGVWDARRQALRLLA